MALALPLNILSAQGATLDLSGPNEAPDDQPFSLDFSLNSPAELSSLKIVIEYDPTVLSFESVESTYLSYDADSSEGEQITFRTTGQSIPEGVSNLGSIAFQPLSTGITRVRVVSISAFAPGDLVVRADAAQSQVLSIVEGNNYIPVPTSAASPSPSETTTISEPINTTTDVEASIIESESSEMTEEETTAAETTQTTELPSTPSEVETSTSDSDNPISTSTTIEETSTISTETSNVTIESQTVSSSDDSDENSGSGFRIELPIIFLLLLAAGITIVIVSRKK